LAETDAARPVSVKNEPMSQLAYKILQLKELTEVKKAAKVHHSSISENLEPEPIPDMAKTPRLLIPGEPPCSER